MSFTISDVSDTVLLTGTVPLDLATAGTYYFKRCKVESPSRKVTIDSSPSADGSFAQDFGDMSWMITGGSLILVATGDGEASIRTQFEAKAALIKLQIGLKLIIPNEDFSGGMSGHGTFRNCVCTAFELMRRPAPDLRTIIPMGDGYYRGYVAMEFVQLSK